MILTVRWALYALAASLAAQPDGEEFRQQFLQIERYYQDSLSHPAPPVGREQLGAVHPKPGRVTRTPLAVWPTARVEEVALEAEPGHTAHLLLLTPAEPARKAIIAVPPVDRTAEDWTGLSGASPPPPWLGGALRDGYTVAVLVPVQRALDHPLCEQLRGKDRRHILHRLGFVTGRTLTGLEVTAIAAVKQWLNVPTGLYAEGDGVYAAGFAAALDDTFHPVHLAQPPATRQDAWRLPVDLTISAYTPPPPPRQTPPLPSAELSAGPAIPRPQIDERRNRHFDGLVAFLRQRIAASASVRGTWRALPPSTGAPKLRALLTEVMGPALPPSNALNPRRTEIARRPAYTAYAVRLDALPGVEAIGHLLIPNGARRAPAVIAQHGLGGAPKDLTLEGPQPNPAYHGFAARLAEHGYVVFAPYVTVPIPQDRLINQLVRMANVLGQMRTNIELAKLRRIVDYLQTLPQVDPDRIGYYGLSYGGYSALWMAPLEPRIRATVVSGHFNHWTTKIISERETTSYLRHPDEDFYNWNVLNRLTHTELLAAFFPRPVMVEFALHDGTTFPAWHEQAWAEAAQAAKAWNAPIVRDRFIGVHEIHGIGAFDFLDRWLRPAQPSSRGLETWGAVEHRITANPLTRVRGTFRTGSAQPVFRGLSFQGAGDPLTVRYGLTPGGAELGEFTVPFKGGRASAPRPPLPLNPQREYHFELRSKGSTIHGPKPLGGTRFPGEFAPFYQPIT
ncbi:MAG: hypothetical protein FJW40_20625 [Acidobacteria bacterium]|nr:hypothetical protein [Acidobacteriota bacterium]